MGIFWGTLLKKKTWKTSKLKTRRIKSFLEEEIRRVWGRVCSLTYFDDKMYHKHVEGCLASIIDPNSFQSIMRSLPGTLLLKHPFVTMDRLKQEEEFQQNSKCVRITKLQTKLLGWGAAFLNVCRSFDLKFWRFKGCWLWLRLSLVTNH